jgi:hypothetical protein
LDAALRCYADADADAWTIATPDDVARALTDLPAALDVSPRRAPSMSRRTPPSS